MGEWVGRFLLDTSLLPESAESASRLHIKVDTTTGYDAMEFQLFRLIGTTDIKRILCSQVEGKNVVYWEDIEDVFPGVKFVQVNGAAVNKMRDQNQTRAVPHRIQHYPDVELDVVLSTTGGGNHMEPPVTTARTTLSFKQVVVRAQKKALESEIEQRLISSFSSEVQAQVRASNGYNSMVQEIKEVIEEKSNELKGCLLKLDDSLAKITELTTENNTLAAQMIEMQRALDAKQDEMKELQIQALGQLALLQKQ
ncbi:hypothetical protein BGZ65_003863, partial [Modicella reniformis]